MAENKTKATAASVERYLSAIKDEARRKDGEDLTKLMTRATRQQPKMWGSSIVGFGSYHFKYESGREGEAPLLAFSARKSEFSLYGIAGIEGQASLLGQLGKYKTGKGCLYIKRLADVDPKVLEKLIGRSLAEKKRRHPSAQ